MAQLHEVLAVESDLHGTMKKMIEEGLSTFKKANLFNGGTRVYHPFDGEEKVLNSVENHQEIVTTVDEKLEYVFKHILKAIDCTYQKEATNQNAKADIIIDGNILVKDVPATMLLNLEHRIKEWRGLLQNIPTLQPGAKWVPDLNHEKKNVYKTELPVETFKTKKVVTPVILYAATKEHPAQIEKVPEDVNVGKFVTEQWSAAYTPADKSSILERVDALAQAIKQARTRANKEEVVKSNIGGTLIKYLLG